MARDEREDAGQFYPGGKVIPRTPVPGGDGGTVKHGEFSGVSAIPDRYTMQQVKGKVNEVLNILKNATVALAVIAFGLRALSDVHTARLDDLYNDAVVVTNVTGIVTTNAVREIVTTATNAAVAAANAYTDAAIQGGGSVTPSIVTNIAGRVTSNVVTKVYVESLGISAGLTTNDVESIVATATNAVPRITDGSNTIHADGTVTKTVVYDDWTPANTPIPESPVYTSCYYKNPYYNEEESRWESIAVIYLQDGYWQEYEGGVMTGPQANDPNATELTFPDGTKTYRRRITTTRLATTNDIPTTAAQVNAYPAASGNQLATQVSTIGAHLNAEDARFVSTNYNSQTRMPEAYVEIKLPDQSWSTVWREMTRWNWLIDSYLPTNYASKAELDQKADRAWGYYDSHTGNYAPDGFTWISSPRIAIAADMAYQRTITSEGAIWVLESSGVVTQTGGNTNGYFRISDDEGNALFEIVKGNKRTIGADASSVQTIAGFTPTKLQIGYSIQADAHPTIEVCTNLVNAVWKSETAADCYANVTWSGSSGAYVAQVQGKANYPQLFVKATYETGGETYIRNEAPVSMSSLILNGVKFLIGTNAISGKLVLTLTPAP